jgi:hypothetical protein
MNKKRSNLKIVTESKTKKTRELVNAPNRSANKPPVAQESVRSAIAEGFGAQVFSSEEQALEVLVSQVVSRYEDDPEEQAEMREFLYDILETDPALRNEILSGATIRR